MAVKKATKTAKTSSKKASAKKAAPKKVASKKASPSVASGTAAKAGTPKKAAASKKAAPKKTASTALKLTDRQLDVLKAVHGTKAAGYPADKKAEAKTLDALASKKLIKKGAKDKASGIVRYHVSKAGEKHVATHGAAPRA
jgi:hypothetical protein